MRRRAIRSPPLSLAGIAIEPLLMDLAQKNVLSGTGSLALDLKTAGANAYAMKSGLGGTLQLRLRDGAVKGINLTQTLRELKAVISPDAQDHTVAADSNKQTEFSEMDADLAFTKGVAAVKRLNFVSPLLRVTQGEPASIDFVRNELDLVARARRQSSASEEGKELIDLKDVTIPVHVRGTFDKPSYTVLWKEAIGGILKRSLENKLRDAVTGKGKGGARGRAQGPAGTMSDAPQHPRRRVRPDRAARGRALSPAMAGGQRFGQWLNRELCPRLAEVSVELRMGYLVLKAPGMLRMDIPLDVIEDDDSVRYSMRVGEQVIDVVDEGELAAAWISNFVQVPCRIMKVHPDTPVSAGPARRVQRHRRFALLLKQGVCQQARHQAPEGRTDSPETEARGGCQQRDQRGLAPRRIAMAVAMPPMMVPSSARPASAASKAAAAPGRTRPRAGHDAQREVRQAVGGGGDVALGRIGMRLGAGADGGADRAQRDAVRAKGRSSPRTPVAATRRDAGGR